MVRINTTGKFEWRKALYDRVGDILGENTRSGAIDGAAEFTEEMVPNLEAAANHPDMTEELADILSTRKVRVDYEVRSGIHINGDERTD